MNKKEIKAAVAKHINGQGNQVPGEVLADIVLSFADLLPDTADIVVNHYLTFRTADAQTNAVKFSLGSATSDTVKRVLYYSYNAKDWYPWKNYLTESLEFSNEKTLYLCGKNDDFKGGYTGSYGGYPFKFESNDVKVYCGGTLMALLDHENVDVEMPIAAFPHMFMNCTALAQAPELTAKTLKPECYYELFRFCTSLQYVKCLATDISANSCTFNWLGGVSATGTFVKAAGVEWSTGANGIPTGWTVQEAA